MPIEECCGNCKHHFWMSVKDGWICKNEESENYTIWTDYEDCCEEWEERE